MTFGTNRGFTGHEHLDAVGLIHMNGRVYDPVLGRFVSPDPWIQDPKTSQSFNRYSYVWNNPLRYTDPTGECSKENSESKIWCSFEDKLTEMILPFVEDAMGESNDNSPSSSESNGTYDYEPPNNTSGQEIKAFFTPLLDKLLDRLTSFDGQKSRSMSDTKDNLNSDTKEERNHNDIKTDDNTPVSSSQVEEDIRAQEQDTSLVVEHIKVEGGLKERAPDTSAPNSIHERYNPNEQSTHITYYDEKGRAFSREDYNQRTRHNGIDETSEGRSAPHEHRTEYSDYGPTGNYVRQLDEKGMPVTDWKKD